MREDDPPRRVPQERSSDDAAVRATAAPGDSVGLDDPDGPDHPDGPDRPDGADDPDRARIALRRLAGDDDATVVRRAAAAVDDLDAAAAFVEEVGLDRLAVAVEAVREPTLRAEGTRALAEFERFRAAAAGDLEPGDLREPPEDLREPPGADDLQEPPGDHFRRGRGTDLRGDGQTSPR